VYQGACSCTEVSKARYRRRISAPLLDRFDLVVPLRRPPPNELLSVEPGESTAAVAARVATARARRAERMRSGADESALGSDATSLLADKLRTGELSARGLQKISRVARTLADLCGANDVSFDHVSEALALRAGREAVVS
jgi:magnesium chelatase family protein